MDETHNLIDERPDHLKAVWTTAFINDLPDGSFLHVLPGCGEKDEDGKTKPRNCRMFPYRDGSGKIDLPHLRNALARIPQSNRIDRDMKDKLAARARNILAEQNKAHAGVKLLHEGGNYALVGGYGVLYYGQDLDGETFTPETDFMLDLVPRKMVFVDHTQGSALERKGQVVKIQGIDDAVGEVVEVTPDDVGLYMRLMLDKAGRYWEIVQGMLESGKAGLSSGSIPHLVRKDGGTIKRWPIVEESLTLTPAEPRTIESVERLKLLISVNPDLKAVLPQELGESSEPDQEPFTTEQRKILAKLIAETILKSRS